MHLSASGNLNILQKCLKVSSNTLHLPLKTIKTNRTVLKIFETATIYSEKHKLILELRPPCKKRGGIHRGS
jgi:hypothetical protein